MNDGKPSSTAFTLGLVVAGSLFVIAQPAFANDHNFRNFMGMNPGIDRTALKQIWHNRMDGASGIGIGVIMPGGGGRPGGIVPHITPVVRITPPVVSNPCERFRDFRNLNPGIDNRALRQAWSANNPSQINIGLIGSNPNLRSPATDVKDQLISFGQFKDLNPGLDKYALKAMYRHIKSGDPADITIGVISTPPGSGRSDAPSIPLSASSSNFPAGEQSLCPVNLITGGGN